MSTEARVVRIIADLAGIELAEVRREHELRADLGLDSIRAMELLALLDDELEVDVAIDEAAHLSTVGQVVDLVRQRAPRGS